MARKKRVPTVRLTIKLTLADKQALESAAATVDREVSWVLGKLCHLAVGKIDLSMEIRKWLRGDTAWDSGLPGDQQALCTIENGEPAVVRAPRQKTVGENPPTLDEIAAYVKLKGYGFTPEEFFDHYTANGWKQANGLPLLDWHVACRNPFQKNWLERNPQAKEASDWGKDRPAEADTPAAPEETEDDQTEELDFDGDGEEAGA